MTISLLSTDTQSCGVPAASPNVATPIDAVRQFEAQLVDGGPQAQPDDDSEDDDEGG